MATHNKISVLLDKKEVMLVKPAEPTPSEALSFSTIDNDPNLEILCQTLYVYQTNANANANGNANTSGNDHEVKTEVPLKSDPALVIKEALSKVLVYYYPLAGKLKRQSDGRLLITCNRDGVPFLEATANCQLSSFQYFDGIDVETAKKFVFDWPTDSDNGYHPLVLQVTKFSCGGFTIGMGLSHSVCDGFGAAQFFRAMAELASGKSEPSIRPVWDRERLVGTAIQAPVKLPVDKASFAISPFLPTTEVVHEQFNVHAESIRKLKMSLAKECENGVVNEGKLHTSLTKECENGVVNEGKLDTSLTKECENGVVNEGKLDMSLTKECENGVVNEQFTTIEVLGAYVWRSRFRALEQNSDGKTLFCLTVGIRRLLNPPLPAGYYGNALVASNVEMTGKDLDEGALSNAAKLIKQSKKIAANSNYIWNSINLLETMNQQNVKVETCGAAMVLTDWRQLKLLEKIDFGWGASVNMIPLPWNIFGHVDLCLFMPPSSLDSSMKGGVRILVCLPEPAMAKFKEEMDALKLLNNDSHI